MKDKKDFKITDRRTFDDKGNPKDDTIEESADHGSKTETENPVKEPAKEKNEEKPESGKKEHQHGHHPIQINFPTFVSSLHAAALMHMGLIQNPSGEEFPVDIELAKQNIDILEMMEEKTKGNLASDEANLLSNILYDLRTKYLELLKKN